MDGISIIIPIYNIAPEFIKKCIKSIECQNNNLIEIIMVDDKSTEEKTIKICNELKENYNNISLISLKKNLGVSNARNVGMKYAKYNWIMFIDADDWISDDCLEYLLNEIQQSKEDVIIFNSNIVFKSYIEKNKFLNFQNNSIITSYDEIVLQIINKKSAKYYPKYNCVGVTWGKVYRKDFILSNNIEFNINLVRAEDHVFFLNLLEKKPIIKYIDKYFYYYRKNSNSAVNKYNKNSKEIFNLTLKELKKYIDKNYKEQHMYIQAYQQRCISYFFSILSSNVFHPENKMKLKDKKKYIIKLISEEQYSSVLYNKKLSFSTKEKTILFLIKIRCFHILNMLYLYAKRRAKKKFD